MKIIIDTHIFLWSISDPSKLDKQKRDAIQTMSNIVYVSSISIAEITIKASIGKLICDFDPVEVALESVLKYWILREKMLFCLKICRFTIKTLLTEC